MAVMPFWKQALVLLALSAGVSPSAAAAPADGAVKRFVAEDATPGGGRPDAACLLLAAALAYDADHIYVADAEDCAVKVFSKRGSFVRAIGRKGRGPGEFSFPTGLSVLGGRLTVADKLNRRLQILDTAGRHIRSLALPFAPDRVLVLAADRWLVTRNASGRNGPEKMLYLLGGGGERLREELTARTTGDPVADAFRNMFVVSPGSHGDFFVVWKSQDRSILHYGLDGALMERIPVDGRYRFKPFTLELGGKRRPLEAFCWECAVDRGRFYLLPPEDTEDGDLGPGDQLFVLDPAGRLEARIDLPCRVVRLAVDGDRIYAVDRESGLRVFRVRR